MAIKIEHSTRFGDYYEAAYARIVKLEINYASNYAKASIGIYRSEEDRASGKKPVLIEHHKYVGSEFEEFFKELSLDAVNTTINPVADVYSSLTKKEGKYKGGIKLYDEKRKEDGELKEVSKDEALK